MPFTTGAAVLATHMTQHPHLRRHDVELLAHHLAEALELHRVMRAGALGVLQPMLDVDPLQGLGQRGALRPRAPMGSDFGAAVALGRLGRGGLGLVEQPELPVGELLRRRAESLGKQQPHLLVQPLNRRLVALDGRRALFEERVAPDNLRLVVMHPRVQRGEFVGHGAGGGSHGRKRIAIRPTA